MFMAEELNEIIETSEYINIYNDGKIAVYGLNETPYNQIVYAWKLMTNGAHEMPAYGVSLNKETVKAMNEGLWVEFVFSKQLWHSGMPFEKLLIKVEKTSFGFNIIRYNSEDGYSGRCYYFDLIGKNMSKFYDFLVNL